MIFIEIVLRLPVMNDLYSDVTPELNLFFCLFKCSSLRNASLTLLALLVL